jgi:hypothetical protein
MFAGDQEYYESLEIMKVGPQQSDTLATSIMSQVEEMATRNFGSAAACVWRITDFRDKSAIRHTQVLLRRAGLSGRFTEGFSLPALTGSAYARRRLSGSSDPRPSQQSQRSNDGNPKVVNPPHRNFVSFHL